MNRLKNKLLAMPPHTTTYKEMYEGRITLIDPDFPSQKPTIEYDPTYYNGQIGFLITPTHKLAQDKPTINIQIPCKLLGISDANDAVADFCLRTFIPYIDELNTDLYNRTRPDNENGKYYICHPGGEILKRNASFFHFVNQKIMKMVLVQPLIFLETEKQVYHNYAFV